MQKEQKQETIQQVRLHSKDTGSTDVQVALLTRRISELTEHLRHNRHDFATRRGLEKLVGHRRRLLRYLSREDTARYHGLLTRLGLRK